MISLFREKRIDDLFGIILKNLERHISQIHEIEILNGDSMEMAKELVKRFSIKPLEIDFEDREVNVTMVNIPWNAFPAGTDVSTGQSYPCANVLYTFKITGNPELLSAKPNKASLINQVNADFSNDSLTIGCQTLYANQQLSEEVQREVKQNMKSVIESMKYLMSVMNKEVQEFNDQLEGTAHEFIESRRKSIKKINDQKQALKNF